MEQNTHRFWVIIKVGANQIENAHTVLYWEKLPFHVRTKWTWYFEYRAALAKVQNPKGYIEFRWGKHEEIELSPAQEISKQLVSAKRTLTKYKNKLAAFEADWKKHSLYPPEVHPKYKPALEKIRRLEEKKEAIENSLKRLENTQKEAQKPDKQIVI
jgi:hypothetical protein